MAIYKTGSGTGTRTVEARQLVSAQDYDLAYWAGGALFQDARRDPEIRVYNKDPEAQYAYAVARRYDWIVKDRKGNVKVVSPEEFRDKYRPAEEKEDTK
jgi:hypothetical protein